MDSKIKRYKAQLKKKEKILNYLLTCRTSYVELYDYEIREVEDTMFSECSGKISEVKSTIENMNIRYRSYLILRMINRTASEMLEIIMLILATVQGYETRKCNKKDRYGDILLDGIKFDIKLYFNGSNENGDMILKTPRDYYQNKIIFNFGEGKKKYILNNFLGYFRDRQRFLFEVVESLTGRYKEVEIHEMAYIRSKVA